MSGTRTAKPGSPLHQERWASSLDYERGLKANLVAMRCKALNDPALRELIWTIQYFSHRPGGLPAVALRLRSLEADGFGKLSVETLAEWLAEFCLNPQCQASPEFLRALRLFAADAGQAPRRETVTEIGRLTHAALDYAQDQRCLVLVEGVARIGKTFAVSQWCAARPGRVRYAQVPSSNDDLSFFIALAKALGLTIESNAKTKNLRPRIEATLQGGDLMLVLDEAHYAWPGHSYHTARPSRICWLMTALVNQGVPVALVVTPQFFKSQKDCEKKTGWACEQLTGRIGDYAKLPDELSMSDLRAVARAHLPEGDAKSIEALALLASCSEKHLAAIEHAVKKARYLAGRQDRGVSQADVRAAIESGVIPADSALARVMRAAPSRETRGTIARAPLVARPTNFVRRSELESRSLTRPV